MWNCTWPVFAVPTGLLSFGSAGLKNFTLAVKWFGVVVLPLLKTGRVKLLGLPLASVELICVIATSLTQDPTASCCRLPGVVMLPLLASGPSLFTSVRVIG